MIHGQSQGKTYKVWKSMKYRCLNHLCAAYPYYGGRGIKVCDRWLKFENFHADMGDKPEGHSIERINNDGNYEPSNCKWASTAEQNNNMRRSHRVTAFGRTQTLTQWSRESQFSPQGIAYRMKNLGMDAEAAITGRRTGRS